MVGAFDRGPTKTVHTINESACLYGSVGNLAGRVPYIHQEPLETATNRLEISPRISLWQPLDLDLSELS